MARSSFGKVLGFGALVGAVAGGLSLLEGKAKAATLPPAPMPAASPPTPPTVRPRAPRPPRLVVATPLRASAPSSGGPGQVQAVPYGGVRPASAPGPTGVPGPASPASAPAGGAMGVPGTADEVPDYAKKSEQTFGPDDTVTPLGLGTAFDLDTRKALPGETRLPPTVRLSVAGYRWVGDETGAGAYRYVVSNPLSPTLFGFDGATIARNLASGMFRKVV